MWRFLSLEYWKARFCGYIKPIDAQGNIGIVAVMCPRCWQMCEVFFENGTNRYVCKHCEHVYNLEVRLVVWEG